MRQPDLVQWGPVERSQATTDAASIMRASTVGGARRATAARPRAVRAWSRAPRGPRRSRPAPAAACL